MPSLDFLIPDSACELLGLVIGSLLLIYAGWRAACWASRRMHKPKPLDPWKHIPGFKFKDAKEREGEHRKY